MSYGDMFVVFGRLTRTKQYEGRTDVKTDYLFPAAFNTLEDAQAFVDTVKGAYKAEIISMRNPMLKKKQDEIGCDPEFLLRVADLLESYDGMFCYGCDLWDKCREKGSGCFIVKTIRESSGVE